MVLPWRYSITRDGSFGRRLDQLNQGAEKIDVGVGPKPFRVVLLGAQHRRAQLHHLRNQLVMKQQRPAMPLH